MYSGYSTLSLHLHSAASKSTLSRLVSLSHTISTPVQLASAQDLEQDQTARSFRLLGQVQGCCSLKLSLHLKPCR